MHFLGTEFQHSAPAEEDSQDYTYKQTVGIK